MTQGTRSPPNEPPIEHPISRIIERFAQSIYSIDKLSKILLPHLAEWTKLEIEKIEDRLRTFSPDFPDTEPEKIELATARERAEYFDCIFQIRELSDSDHFAMLARSFFLQMFAEYDVFIGSLLTVIYKRNSELLKGISREITLSDLVGFESIDAVTDALLEKEIETFRRDSYVEQFKRLETQFDIRLRKFQAWPQFVELGQRRNLFTHNDGRVSEQYKVVCLREGCIDIKDLQVGERLEIDWEYFREASMTLTKVGTMLSHTLWMKVFPKERGEIQKRLNDFLYSQLKNKRWRLVSNLRNFALSGPMTRDISDIDEKIRTVNIAIAYKNLDQDSSAHELLEQIDWSATYRDFKLALAVLREEWSHASEIMESIGREGELVDQDAYHSWPLFIEFRKTSEFHSSYEKIYGESFYENLKSQDMDEDVGTAFEGQAPDASSASSLEKSSNGSRPVEQPFHGDE